jgi:hypothetical protein
MHIFSYNSLKIKELTVDTEHVQLCSYKCTPMIYLGYHKGDICKNATLVLAHRAKHSPGRSHLTSDTQSSSTMWTVTSPLTQKLTKFDLDTMANLASTGAQQMARTELQ